METSKIMLCSTQFWDPEPEIDDYGRESNGFGPNTDTVAYHEAHAAWKRRQVRPEYPWIEGKAPDYVIEQKQPIYWKVDPDMKAYPFPEFFNKNQTHWCARADIDSALDYYNRNRLRFKGFVLQTNEYHEDKYFNGEVHIECHGDFMRIRKDDQPNIYYFGKSSLPLLEQICSENNITLERIES